MALTKADLRTLTKQLVGNRTSTTIDDTWYDTRVYNAYRRICTFQGPVQGPGIKQPSFRRLGFFELQSRDTRSLTTALTSNFVTPIATNVVTVLDVYDRTNNRGLSAMNISDVRASDPDSTGRPTKFCPGGQGGAVGYWIDRVPASSTDNIDVYEYSYLYPTALVADGDYPIIPDPWHQPIAYAAASEAASLMDMPDKAQELEQRFISYIAERKTPMEEAGYKGLGGARRFSIIGSRY